MVFDVLGALKSAIRIQTVDIDNAIFKLHYRFTAIILLAFSILVTARQYFGDPIDCMPIKDVPGPMLDQYCWIESTFLIPSSFHKKHGAGTIIAKPGLSSGTTEGEEAVHYQYYQWVCFVLFLQAIAFYVPHYLWKLLEGGRIKALVAGINTHVVDKKSKEDRLEVLRDYFFINLSQHNLYFYKFVFCEVLNLVQIIAQILITDAFLGGEFSSYGLEVLKFSTMKPEDRTDPMTMVFPRVTKCLFNDFGRGGGVQVHDTICILPMNIINEKMYIFLWFWFITLATLTAVGIVYRLVGTFVSKARFTLFRIRARNSPPYAIDRIFHKVQIGDWFFLQMLSKNIDAHIFKEFVVAVAKELEDGNLSEKYELKDYGAA